MASQRLLSCDCTLTSTLFGQHTICIVNAHSLHLVLTPDDPEAELQCDGLGPVAQPLKDGLEGGEGAPKCWGERGLWITWELRKHCVL
jgi:hypothetical protein